MKLSFIKRLFRDIILVAKRDKKWWLLPLIIILIILAILMIASALMGPLAPFVYPLF